MNIVEANRIHAAETRLQQRMKSRVAQWWMANFNDEYIARAALDAANKTAMIEAAAHLMQPAAPVVQLRSLRAVSPDQPTPVVFSEPI